MVIYAGSQGTSGTNMTLSERTKYVCPYHVTFYEIVDNIS